jgi:predicted amidohydrolase YtcJ
MAGPITVFGARSILTMDPAVPKAPHVAVRDGVILEVGTTVQLCAWSR